jgi:hypothetical protein
MTKLLLEFLHLLVLRPISYHMHRTVIASRESCSVCFAHVISAQPSRVLHMCTVPSIYSAFTTFMPPGPNRDLPVQARCEECWCGPFPLSSPGRR